MDHHYHYHFKGSSANLQRVSSGLEPVSHHVKDLNYSLKDIVALKRPVLQSITISLLASRSLAGLLTPFVAYYDKYIEYFIDSNAYS